MKIRAILFDLHHTITRTRESPYDLIRKISSKHGIDLSDISDVKLENAFLAADRFLFQYQIQNNVGPHWGSEAEHWVDADRKMFEALGLKGIGDETLLKIESDFKYETTRTDFEALHENSLELLTELRKRGYELGICTRRHDNPIELLKREGIHGMISAVTWSGVPGYAKPSPYTLFEAADEIGINPNLCAFVGNLVNSDVDAAIRAGMQPILLTWANVEEKVKAPEGVTIIENPLDILSIFD